jgi:hypothetical protein
MTLKIRIFSEFLLVFRLDPIPFQALQATLSNIEIGN